MEKEHKTRSTEGNYGEGTQDGEKSSEIEHLLVRYFRMDSTVSGVLSVPRGVTCALLYRNKWSLTSVYDHWFAAADDSKERKPNSVKRIAENTDRNLAKVLFKLGLLSNSFWTSIVEAFKRCSLSHFVIHLVDIAELLVLTI